MNVTIYILALCRNRAESLFNRSGYCVSQIYLNTKLFVQGGLVDEIKK